MPRQIRPLNLFTPLELLKLAMVPHNRRANIPRLPRLRPLTALRIVTRQGIAPPQMEASPARTPRPRTIIQRRGHGFLGGDGAVGAHLPRGDAEGGVAESVGGDEVQRAEDEGEDAGGDDDAPGGGAEGVLGGGGLVEVAEGGDAEDEH